MNKIPFLAVALIAALSPRALANPDVYRVDIYRHMNFNDPPSGEPFTGFAGQYGLPGDINNNFDLNIDFGNPFGLTSFVAVLTFTEYSSNGGFFEADIESENNMWDWPGENQEDNPEGPFSIGGNNDVIAMAPGFTTYQFDYFAFQFVDGDLGLVGGGPNTLYLNPPSGSNDPRLAGTIHYLVPLPDSGSTLTLLGGALIALFTLRTYRRRSESVTAWMSDGD